MTDNISHRAQLAKEIEDALRTSARPLSSAELTGMCHSAQDSTDIGRVIYYLRDQGIVTQAGEPIKVPGRNPTKMWMLCSMGAPDVDTEQPPATDSVSADIDSDIAALADYLAADAAAMRSFQPRPDTDTAPSAAGHCADIPVTDAEDEFCDHCMSRLASARLGERCDPTELALADLVDQADEAVLALGDTLMCSNPAWTRMRELQEDVFAALCDYRALTRTKPAPAVEVQP